jgi:hypothetical protein
MMNDREKQLFARLPMCQPGLAIALTLSCLVHSQTAFADDEWRVGIGNVGARYPMNVTNRLSVDRLRATSDFEEKLPTI